MAGRIPPYQRLFGGYNGGTVPKTKYAPKNFWEIFF